MIRAVALALAFAVGLFTALDVVQRNEATVSTRTVASR